MAALRIYQGIRRYKYPWHWEKSRKQHTLNTRVKVSKPSLIETAFDIPSLVQVMVSRLLRNQAITSTEIE